MSWLDPVIATIVIVGAFWGFRSGLISAAFAGAGVIIGWLVAGQLSDKVGRLFGSSLSGETWVTVISYAAIMGAVMVLAWVLGRAVRPLLSMATLGLAGLIDKLGGAVWGLVAGVAVSAALIVAMARFAYDFEAPQKGIAGSVAARFPNVEGTRETVEEALTASFFVPTFIDVADALPADALGLVPPAFKTSLDILEQNIEGSS